VAAVTASLRFRGRRGVGRAPEGVSAGLEGLDAGPTAGPNLGSVEHKFSSRVCRPRLLSPPGS